MAVTHYFVFFSLVASLVACAQESPVTEASPPSDAAPGNEQQAAKDGTVSAALPPVAVEFVELAAQQSAETATGLDELTAVGSSAHAYANFVAGQTLANRASGFTVDPWRVEVQEDGILVCDSAGCTRYHDFEVEDDLLSTFAVDELPLEGRIVGPAEPVGTRFGTVQRTSSYLASSDGPLVITLTVEAAANLFVWVAEAVYQGPEVGREQVSGWAGPNDVRAGATGWYAVEIPTATLEGVLDLELEDYLFETTSVQLPASP